MKLVVVIPAYNAGRHLRGVVDRVRTAAPVGLHRIVIVNDGSSDDTRALSASLAVGDPGVTLVDRPRNGGYGAAMKDALAAARAAGADVVACVHADGQYSPEALPELLEDRARRGLDVLQGSRIAGGAALAGGMPVTKYVANWCLNRIENVTLGLTMTDYHSGYLVYGPRALAELSFGCLSDSFDFDLEVIASARARGLLVGEAPIPTHYGDEISYLRPIPYTLRVLRVLWRYRRGAYARS